MEKTRERIITEMKATVEQYVYRTGVLPNIAALEAEFQSDLTESGLKFFDLIPEVLKWQRQEGLEGATRPDWLEPRHFIIAQMVLNTSDRRSIRTKLKEAGISVKEYDNVRRLPEFQQYFRAETQRRFGQTDSVADLELIKLVEDGDLNGIRYFNEFAGRMAAPEAVNVARVLATMMEILVQYVSADVLSKIAAQMEERIYNSQVSQALSAESRPQPQIEVKLN